MSQTEIDRALREHSAGRLAEAEAIYREILQQHPNHPPALHLLGVALSQQGNKRAAIDYISRAIALNPNIADFHSNLALAYCETGEPEKAVPACHKALALQKDHSGALNQLGMAMKQMGRLEESVECFQRAVAVQPDFAVCWGNLADSLRRLGRASEADACYERILGMNPEDPKALCARAETFLNKNKIDDAIALFGKAAEKFPSEWITHNGLGVAFSRQGNLDKAVACFEKAVSLAPESAGPLNNLGHTYVLQGRIDEGLAAYDKALAIRPDFPDAYNNLGNALLAKLDLEGASKAYEKTLFFQPDHFDAHWNRALLHLLQGDFDRGWLEYEWRWLKFPDQRRFFRQPRWDGFDIAGKTILLYAEQGFGDTIQFVRLAPLVAALGATVNLECPRELSGLLQHVPGVARTLSRGDPLPPFDVQCPLLSLPRALGLTAESTPRDTPYLRVDENLQRRWQQRLRPFEKSFKIGIAWAGAAIHARDCDRSTDAKAFAPLAAIPGVQLFSLQLGDSTKARSGREAGFELTDFTSELHDFADTAALLMNLDLVIAADTAVVHLAGALNRPVWTLLAFSPDWRWLLNHSDTMWYPSMRLFRQPTPGDWTTLFERVASQLKKELASRSSANPSSLPADDLPAR
ncbi:MAG TPA: tetratricopeptide repeat protein [Tepidisphaeraceae bacterium]|jgi:tetratricopeptide (TPR) repeat protein|nr:tetratricopeptide repeat protein [Tepidisphaeraceae bacterium]